MLHDFQKKEDRDKLKQFALLGFGRYNPRNLDSIRYPYKRGHVYSAMILNLELLKKHQVYYDPDIHIWEDIEFNERVAATRDDAGDALMICKIQRYMQHKKQMNHGGCNGNIARPEAVLLAPDPGHTEEPKECPFASWLDGLGLTTDVTVILKMLADQSIKSKSDLVGISNSDLVGISNRDLPGIRIPLGDANKITRAIGAG